ncbi:MAG: hypothetical protein MI976_26100 [Pseudomonadales bacterium]|nr:hypothetical protein [Pseudomonadales bacterium]
MFSFGRWLVLVALAIGVMACGGKKDPRDNIERDSFVVFESVGSDDDSDALVYSGTSRTTDVTVTTFSTIALYRDGNSNKKSENISFELSKISGIPYDGDDDSDEYNDLQFAMNLEYFNNQLESVDFSLNQINETFPYGYNLEIFDKETDELVWSSLEMLNWCTSSLDDAFFDEDFTTKEKYSEPSNLDAADSWEITDDDRFRSCPSEIRPLVLQWRGRYMDDITAKFTELETTDFDTDDGEDDIDPPTFEEAVREVLIDADNVPMVPEGNYRLEITLNMNEFEGTEPYKFTISVDSKAYEDL